MQLIRTLFIAAIGLFCVVAQAQWQWVDNAGRKVFSDRPPPSDIPAKNILKQPGKAAGLANTPVAPAPTGAASTSAAAAPAAPPPMSAEDKELLAKKKKAEGEASARTKEEADVQARTKASNCEKAKANQGLLDSGVRMAITNAKGEREFLDDAGRKAAGERARESIEAYCR